MPDVGDRRVVQKGPAVWSVEEWTGCPCPDCPNPAHGEWKVRGGATNERAAITMAGPHLIEEKED